MNKYLYKPYLFFTTGYLILLLIISQVITSSIFLTHLYWFISTVWIISIIVSFMYIFFSKKVEELDNTVQEIGYIKNKNGKKISQRINYMQRSLQVIRNNHNILQKTNDIKNKISLQDNVSYEYIINKIFQIISGYGKYEKVLLILKKDHTFLLKNIKTNFGKAHYRNKRVDFRTNVAESLIKLTLRNQRTNFLHNPHKHPFAKNDPYYREKRADFLLMIPFKVISKIDVQGVICFEDTREISFHPETVEVLKTTINSLFHVHDNKELVANLEQQVEQRTSQTREQLEIIQEKNNRITSILDSIDEGILLIDSSFQVVSGFSKKCEDIFLGNPLGRDISYLLSQDEHKQNLLKSILKKIFQSKDELQREVVLSLLPTHISLKNGYYKMQYKFLTFSQRILIIMHDISETKNLQDEIFKKKNQLSMVVNILKQKHIFMNNINNFKNFVTQELFDIIADNELLLLEKMMRIKRIFHTFKGIFHQFELYETANTINNFENDIIEFEGNFHTSEDLLNFIKKYNMRDWIEKDFIIITDILKTDLRNSIKNEISLSQADFDNFEKTLMLFSPQKLKYFLSDKFKKLTYKPLETFLRKYHDFIEKLASMLDKPVNPLQIRGDTIKVDPQILSGLIDSFVHIFRNMMDHGIESLSERMDLGKSDNGTILINIESIDNEVIIIIEDDGRGIDLKKVKDVALSKNLINQNISQKQLINVIFNDDFTTLEEETQLSGKGNGLAAVKAEVQKLNGEINVESEMNKFTRFIIKFPYQQNYFDQKLFSKFKFFENFIKTTKVYFHEITGLKIFNIKDLNIYKVDKLNFLDVTAIVYLYGVAQVSLCISVSNNFAEKMVPFFLENEDLDPSEITEMLSDVIQESLNIISGNFLAQFPEINILEFIGIPLVLKGSNINLQHSDSIFWESYLETKFGNIKLVMTTPK